MNIAIIGGGIGGLTLAIALRRNGFRPVVYEQAPVIREIGAGLWIQPNGMEILKRLGIATPAAAAGVAMRRILVGGESGEIWQHFDFDEHRIAERFGATSVAIHRGQLQGLLAEHVPDIRTGHQLLAMETTTNHVRLTFNHGRQVEADIVLGADGIHSTVRRLTLGPIPLRYSGQTCWRVVIPWFLEGEEQFAGVELWGRRPGVRIGYGHIGPADVYVYMTQATEAGGADDPSTLIERLHGLFADFPPKIHVMLDAMEPRAVFRSDLYDIPPLRQWWSGRVALLGDAVHATTPNLGQGACQAMESAYALAQALADEKDLNVAFSRYQQSRQQKTRTITRQSFRLSRMANAGGMPGTVVRAVMKYSPLWMLRGQFEKVYRLTI